MIECVTMMQFYTSSAHAITITPASITLTGPICSAAIALTQLITSVTCETTSVFIGRNSVISQ